MGNNYPDSDMREMDNTHAAIVGGSKEVPRKVAREVIESNRIQDVYVFSPDDSNATARIKVIVEDSDKKQSMMSLRRELKDLADEYAKALNPHIGGAVCNTTYGIMGPSVCVDINPP